MYHKNKIGNYRLNIFIHTPWYLRLHNSIWKNCMSMEATYKYFASWGIWEFYFYRFLTIFGIKNHQKRKRADSPNHFNLFDPTGYPLYGTALFSLLKFLQSKHRKQFDLVLVPCQQPHLIHKQFECLLQRQSRFL